jgi:hypothetical protein
MTKTAVVSTRERREVLIDVTQTEPRPIRYGKGEYLPQTLVIVYERKDDDPWQASTRELRGPKIRKDGSLSEALGAKETLWWHDPIPEWVTRATEQAAPTAPVS